MASGVLQLHGHTHILHRTIASGGMAEIILATKHGMGGFEKLIAIKRILPHLLSDPQFVDMFVNEARLAALLRHPNILEIYDFYSDNNGLYIIMEYLSGESLSFINATCARRGTTPPIPIVCRVASDVAAGLDYAYNDLDAEGAPRRVVHRDVSHVNIVLTYQGMVKLVDFGVAKATRFDLRTMPGTLKGKLGYCAPELLAGGEADSRSDIFSLGVVLHEMLTGRRLFMGDNFEQAVRSIAETPIHPPSASNSDVPLELDELVMEMLERDPNKRVQRAEDIRERLDAILGGTGKPMNRKLLGEWLQKLLPERFQQRKEVENQAVRRARTLTPVSGGPRSGLYHSGNVVDASKVLNLSGGQQVQVVEPESSRHPWLLPTALATAGTAVVLVLVIVLFWRGPSQAPDPPPAGERAVMVSPAPPPTIQPAADELTSDSPKRGVKPTKRKRFRRRGLRKNGSGKKPEEADVDETPEPVTPRPAAVEPKPAAAVVPAPPPPPPLLDKPKAEPAPAVKEPPKTEPPVKAKPKSAWGILHVLSDIRGHVFIDGQKTDLRTPAKLKLAPGDHDIVLLIKDPNVRRIGQRVTITAGKTTQIRFTGER